MGFWSTLFGERKKPDVPSVQRTLEARWGEIEVQGESFRRDAVRRLFEQRGLPRGGVMMSIAELHPEPMNPYDRNAVRVVVDGWHIGYVPGEISAQVAAASGEVGISAPVRVWADPKDGTWRARATLFPERDEEEDYADRPAYATHERVKPQFVVVGEPLDLRHLESVRLRMKGLANYVDPDERAAVGATAYLLVREPTNTRDPNAVVIASADGRKLGYVSASRAKVLAPCLDSIGAVCYLVGGAAAEDNSLQLSVHLPKADAIRKFSASS